MKISNIEISNFRNYTNCSTTISPKLNWIYGENGQGKTNFVEAVHYLCNLNSFRTRKTSNIIQKNKSEAIIQAQIERLQVKHFVRINVSKKGRRVLIDNSPSYHVSEYILSFMAIVFTPENVSLFRNAPQERRKFINRVFSFLDTRYFNDLQEYTKIISQKNSQLRRGNTKNISIWNEMHARSSIKLMVHRHNFVEQINVHLHDIFMELSGRSENLRLIYEPSLNVMNFNEKNCFIQLEKNLEREIQYGFSLIGPHRDEFHLEMNEQKDKDFFSQGEFRITNLSLKMTINHLLYEKYKFHPVLIFDDLFSELDKKVINKVLQLFIKIKNQIFITSTTKPQHSLPGKCLKISKGMIV